MTQSGCKWTEDSDGNWFTDCDNGHMLNEGTPFENDMVYCCYCGKMLVEVRYVDPWDEEEEDEKARDRQH